MKNIKIVPYGGLCNRLIFINSIIELANKNQLSVKCLWFKNKEVYASPIELFDIKFDNIKFLIIDTKKFLGYCIYIIYKLLKKINVLLIDQLKYYNNNECLYDKYLNKIQSKHIIATGCHSIYKKYSDNIFMPKKKYSEVSNCVFKNADLNSIVSVHVRRTDSIYSIKISSNDKVLDVIENEINNKNKIFLCSDDIEFKKKIFDKYAGNIIIQNISYVERDSFKGIEFALIDLICLSKGKKIYGSYGSTFSSFAAQLGEKELIVIK